MKPLVIARDVDHKKKICRFFKSEALDEGTRKVKLIMEYYYYCSAAVKYCVRILVLVCRLLPVTFDTISLELVQSIKVSTSMFF